MNNSTKNVMAFLLLLFSLTFFIAANHLNTTYLINTGDCHSCASISACEDGGQVSGYHDCEYFPGHTPPDNCRVIGFPNCDGGGTDPSEN